MSQEGAELGELYRLAHQVYRANRMAGTWLWAESLDLLEGTVGYFDPDCPSVWTVRPNDLPSYGRPKRSGFWVECRVWCAWEMIGCGRPIDVVAAALRLPYAWLWRHLTRSGRRTMAEVRAIGRRMLLVDPDDIILGTDEVLDQTGRC